jgi:hypothetical protein
MAIFKIAAIKQQYYKVKISFTNNVKYVGDFYRIFG